MTPFDANTDAVHLDALANRWALPIDASRSALLHFAELVSRWGQRTDLVAARTPKALVEVLFLDALFLADQCPPDARVLDVGAGAGAPALPLALLRPDLELTLLEPRRKRVAFMRTAVGALGLSGRAHVEEGRLEEGEERDFDVAYSRATFAPDEWLRRGSNCARRVFALLAVAESPSLPGWETQTERTYETAAGAPRRLLQFVAQ